VQPYVGIKSDRCRSRFGKRRPFMVGGAVATIVSLMILAWTREIVTGFLSLFGVDPESQGTKTSALVLAVTMVYILDFSINVIQAGIRAFIVDNAPTHQQDAANAWASRVSGMGNIIGYLFGYANLPKYMWFFGNTQFKVLCVIASLGLTTTLAISCFYISERDPRLEGRPAKEASGIIAFFKALFRSIQRLPSQIKAVCVVQLAAWIGWFPFLFYITTYIGELHVEPIFRDNPNMTDKEIDEAWEHGTRVGTFALLIFAIVSFSASVVLPWFIAKTYEPPAPALRTPMLTPGTPTANMETNGYFTSRDTEQEDSRSGLKSAVRNLPFPRKMNLEIRWLTIKRAWLLSHLMFALITWLTFLAKNTTVATILAALIGIPWAMTMWAPFALIAAEVSKRENIRRGLIRPPPTRDGELLSRGEDVSEGADQAGVVLGIHNVAVAAPQVVATLVSSAIFKALQKPRGSVGDDSVGWVLRFGGLAALGAAWLKRRVREEGEEENVGPKF
jgi:solute carrier family 45 protein 1/2/4